MRIIALGLVLFVGSWVVVEPLVVRAQAVGQGAAPQAPTIPQVRAEDEGLLVPREGEVIPGNGRRVLVNDPASKSLAVTKVLSEIGERLIVILPNGRLHSIKTTEATVTDRPFVGATKEQLTAELSAKFPKFKIRSTKRFLYVYNTSELFSQGTSRILETMYQPLFEYWKRLKVPVEEPSTLLVVVMFKTDREFQAYRKMPEGVVAYYNGINNQVVMYEQSELVNLSPELAVKEAIATVAHEGCHQIFANIGVQQRMSEWPMWLSEGLPEYFSPTSVDKGARWKGVGLVNDLRMKAIDQYLQENSKQIKPGEISTNTIRAQRLDSTGYAFAWGVTHYLAERKKEKFATFLRDVATQPPFSTLEEEECQALFVKHFGNDFTALEREIGAHLNKLPYVDPYELLTHYVCMVEQSLGISTRRTVYVTYAVSAVKQFQGDVQRNGNPASTKFNIRSFPNRKTAEAFADAWLKSP